MYSNYLTRLPTFYEFYFILFFTQNTTHMIFVFTRFWTNTNNEYYDFFTFFPLSENTTQGKHEKNLWKKFFGLELFFIFFILLFFHNFSFLFPFFAFRTKTKKNAKKFSFFRENLKTIFFDYGEILIF